MRGHLKIALVVGTRPQFIKLAPVMDAIAEFRHIVPVVIHTGQHYDFEMSKVFFEEFKLPEPQHNLGVGSGTHAEQVGKMMIGLERILQSERPNVVVVFGDSNTTLAGALAAAKLKLPVAHIEAGVRCGENIPEEINRLAVDSISNYLFCPTNKAFNNVLKTGNSKKYWLGDVMWDILKKVRHQLRPAGKERYIYATFHREENTSSVESIMKLLRALNALKVKTILPLHPRVRERIAGMVIPYAPKGLHVINPVSYMESLRLISGAAKVITDSGGVQKEAYLLEKPCITIRKSTEWPETLKDGWNVLVPHLSEGISFPNISTLVPEKYLFGDGSAAYRIIRILYEEVER